MSWVMRAADPPLDPTADQARSLLRRELLKPEYNDQALVARFVDWLRELLARGVDAAAGSPPLTTLAAMVLLVLLVVGLAWALGRARRGARSAAVDGAVLGEDGLTAVELRARAESALAAGDHVTALLDAFRALALRQVERGRIEGLPGATAHELSGALGDAFPPLRDRLVAAAGNFDRVLYGERPATAGQARAVLTLDDELVGVR